MTHSRPSTPMLKTTLYTLIGTLSILFSVYINPINHYINALLLLLTGVALYFYIVIKVADWNWLDIRAMFTAVWLVTLGLTALRLTNYQKQWLPMTWVLCAAGYAMFQIGSSIGLGVGTKFLPSFSGKSPSFGKISFRFTPERLFAICIITTLIGLTCFSINVAIKGFIPCFSNDIFAYRNFYTKFHIFSTASTMVCGLCYYCIKTQPLSRFKKLVLWLCIFYTLILFPIFVVSRGVFVVAALVFTTVVFYLNKRKFLVLVICIAMILGVYMFTSNLRSFSDTQLDQIFQPSDIILGVQPDDNTSTDSSSDGSSDPDSEIISFRLPPKIAFLYGYLTVSHDNLNEAVKYTEGYTWGARQLKPFNVILRIPFIDEVVKQGEFYQVTPNFNTINMLGIFYYDLHEIGVIVFMLVWSFVFALIQASYQCLKGPFSLMVLGVVMCPVTLSFFASWVDSFDLWMFCGVVLIFAIASSIHIKKKI